MIDAPILTAEEITINAVKAALTPFVGAWNSRPKAYYQRAEQGAPLPFVVFHFQSDITRVDWIGITGATGLLTIKAVAASGSAARALCARCVLTGLAYPGYVLKATYQRSPAIGPVDDEWQSLNVYRLEIERV